MSTTGTSHNRFVETSLVAVHIVGHDVTGLTIRAQSVSALSNVGKHSVIAAEPDISGLFTIQRSTEVIAAIPIATLPLSQKYRVS